MRQLRVALVHDFLGEFGGAERVFLALSEMFPEAPIYTAFVRPGAAYERFKNRDLRPSWAHQVPLFASKLHSPLRFLAPVIWESFDFSGYELVISSASWYITKGILTGPGTTHICYVHSPPRYLYGYPTSIEWQKYWPVRLYGNIINHFLREYDFVAAQRPDVLVANSQNVRRRIQKFYRRDAKVVYPPVELAISHSNHSSHFDHSRDYYLAVSRVVGGKGLRLAVQACSELELPLVVVGEPAGWSREFQELKQLAGKNVRFTGRVSDEELVGLYRGAKALLATAQDEDFGLTPVEAMLCGTPVIAYRGGGYLETVVEGKTGIFFDEYSVRGLKKALGKFKAFEPSSGREFQGSKFKIRGIQKYAQKYSKQRFVKEMTRVIEQAVSSYARITRG